MGTTGGRNCEDYRKSKRMENVVACLEAKEIFERDIL